MKYIFFYFFIYQVHDTFHVALIFFWNETWSVNPTIIRRHFDVDSFEVATDRLSEVLADDSDQRSGQEDDDASFVKELEEPIVNVPLVEL